MAETFPDGLPLGAEVAVLNFRGQTVCIGRYRTTRCSFVKPS